MPNITRLRTRPDGHGRVVQEGLGRVPGTPRPAGRRLRELVDAGQLNLPFPAVGATPERLRALACLGSLDLSLARLSEGHTDALAILAEAGRAAQPGTVYGVWAATSPAAWATATRTASGWRLAGHKQFCSGADTVDRALVTVETEDGTRLLDLDCTQPAVRPVPGTWPAVGMADSCSLDVVFEGAEVDEADEIGGPGFYTSRPGFWHGSVGVAACWYGGGRGLVRGLVSYLADRQADEHQCAHLGALTARCDAMALTLDDAGRRIDADPENKGATFPWLALEVRHLIEAGCTEVLERVGRAGGARPVSLDGDQSRRAADLYVYLRQHHGERDLAQLGRLALEAPAWH
jgi:alkylation response protein AidB-like acyl-CoA dehydrogenase